MAISSQLGSSALLPAGLGFRNLLINGDMRVSQRGLTLTIMSTPQTTYLVDRWFIDSAQSFSSYRITQETDAPNGFGNSVKIVPTSNGFIFSDTKIMLSQRIEAINCSALAKGTVNSKTMSLSFWVKAFSTGTYAVEVVDDVNTRCISLNYTINSSATWEYKTVQVPADTTGTIPVSTSSGLRLNFWIRAGSSYTSGTSNVWASTVNANRAAGHNVVNETTSNYWQVTGVQLEQNSQPTPFEQRPIGVELALCQRYYFRNTAKDSYSTLASALCYSTTNAMAIIYLPVQLRNTPITTVNFSGIRVWNPVSSNAPAVTAAITDWASNQTLAINFTVSGGFSTGTPGLVQANNTIGGYFDLSAEL